MNQTMKRRDFLKGTMGLGWATARLLYPTRLLAQIAPNPTNYRALVCITLDGGADSNNHVVPLQTDQYASYYAARPDIAVDKRSVLPFATSSGATFGFNCALPTLSLMYAKGQCAVVANVGPLLQPITKQQFLNNPQSAPTAIENHELQRVEWGTSFSQVSAVAQTHSGWGGQMADALQSYSSGVYPIVTELAQGLELSFGAGANTQPAILTAGAFNLPDHASNSLQTITKLTSNSTMVNAAANGLKAAYEQDAAMRSAVSTATPLKTQFPTTLIGTQLKQIAILIGTHTALGLQRQIFLAQHFGFDSHSFQIQSQGTVLAQLDAAIAAFQSALAELGVSDDVLTFTTSDFGRTLLENSSGGSDHAWGAHHFVFGTGMKRADMYGTFPSLIPGGPDDYSYLNRGCWLPTTAVDQYGATLASWMGVPDSSLTKIFPNLGNFSIRNLGFI